MKKSIFESQWTLFGNVIVLSALGVGLRKIDSEYRYVCYLVLMLAIPFYVMGIISVIRYNAVIERAQIIKAEILPQALRLKRSYRGMSQFNYTCRYNSNYFKGTFSVKNKDVEKVEAYVRANPEINVAFDYINNRNVIMIQQYLESVCYSLEEYFCSPAANYIMLALAVVLVVMTII